MNTLHQLNGFKANHEKQVTTKTAQSSHKMGLIRPNPAMEMAEGKALVRPLDSNTSAIYSIPRVYGIYLSLELHKLLFLASSKDAAMP